MRIFLGITGFIAAVIFGLSAMASFANTGSLGLDALAFMLALILIALCLDPPESEVESELIKIRKSLGIIEQFAILITSSLKVDGKPIVEKDEAPSLTRVGTTVQRTADDDRVLPWVILVLCVIVVIGVIIGTASPKREPAAEPSTPTPSSAPENVAAAAEIEPSSPDPPAPPRSKSPAMRTMLCPGNLHGVGSATIALRGNVPRLGILTSTYDGDPAPDVVVTVKLPFDLKTVDTYTPVDGLRFFLLPGTTSEVRLRTTGPWRLEVFSDETLADYPDRIAAAAIRAEIRRIRSAPVVSAEK